MFYVQTPQIMETQLLQNTILQIQTVIDTIQTIYDRADADQTELLNDLEIYEELKDAQAYLDELNKEYYRRMKEV